jgi:hypothetical protein
MLCRCPPLVAARDDLYTVTAMRFLPHTVLLALLGLLPFQKGQEPDPGRPTLSDTQKKSADAFVTGMQGLWRLEEMRTPRQSGDRRMEAGYLLVSGLCFSFELHYGYVAPDGHHVVDKNFLSGTHRFEIDDAGSMNARSVIGAYFNTQGLLQFEEPNKLRRYQVKVAGETMSWSNDDGAHFLFKQLPEPRTMKRDVFGRPLPDTRAGGKGERKDEPEQPPK